MMDPKQSRRPYSSLRRREQASETRREILEAAGKLFAERGYSGATVGAIAEDARCSAETVYAVFGSKSQILLLLAEGLKESLPMGGLRRRRGPTFDGERDDPYKRVLGFAGENVGWVSRTAGLVRSLQSVRTDPQVGLVVDGLMSGGFQAVEALLEDLRSSGALRSHESSRDLAETVWVICSPGVFDLLVSGRGWSQEQYTSWLSGLLSALLLK
jgi:AcrR family transcriptional regulator